MEPLVDAVIVSYKSADTLRGCVAPLVARPDVHVTVVDNASPDGGASLASIADLDLAAVESPRNGGFSYGCNLGAVRGSAPYLLFLNPDARIDDVALDALLATLDRRPETALVGPKLLEPGDELAYSRRRFPSQRRVFAQALFLHRLWPRATWTDETIRDAAVYDEEGPSEWVSGACMLIRRDVFEAIGGFDERFFLYCEDADLCARVWAADHEVRYVPGAVVRHVGGHSSGAGETQAILARSRVAYIRKHHGRVAASVHAFGVALGEATHAVTSFRNPPARRGHLAASRAAFERG